MIDAYYTNSISICQYLLNKETRKNEISMSYVLNEKYIRHMVRRLQKKKKGYSIVFVTFVKKKEKKSEMNEVK